MIARNELKPTEYFCNWMIEHTSDMAAVLHTASQRCNTRDPALRAELQAVERALLRQCHAATSQSISTASSPPSHEQLSHA
jgi:hypothetical protein